MRYKKIRGNRKRLKLVELWRQWGLDIDLDRLANYQYEYTKIYVKPYSNIMLLNSQIPQPKGMIKQKMLSGLIDIYDSWKAELDKRGEPYYLKIWLFEPRFSKSQVVCAIGKRIEYYENTFFEPELEKIFHPDNYGTLKTRLAKLNWKHRIDEDYYDNSDLGKPADFSRPEDYEEHKKWFEKQLKKPHRTIILEEPIGDITETYCFKQGNLWIGGE